MMADGVPADPEVNLNRTRDNYRKRAFERYRHEHLGGQLCAHCGFGIPAILEVAHIDTDRSNNDLCNLVILCPNCHKMLDLGLISAEIIIAMRERSKVVDWRPRMKDAGRKAAITRRKKTISLIRSRAGKLAAETLRKKREGPPPRRLLEG